VCPPPTDTAETDLKPCGGTRQQQGGTLYADLAMGSYDPALGTARLAQILALASNPNKSFVNRVVTPTSGLCTPGAAADGCLESTATRRVGTVNIGGLPSVMTAPAGWSGASAWQGYFISLVGYEDVTTAAAGTVAPLPTATVSGGTVYVWNGLGYDSFAWNNAGLNALNRSATITEVVSGKTVSVTMATVTAGMAVGATSVTPTTPVGTATRTDVDAIATPPRIEIQYTVKINGTTKVDLLITLNLKNLEARGVYAAAPAQGS
jgi:hypothetical protein